MNKTAIKNFAIWARNKLIADITYKAGLLGITEKEIKSPLPQSTKDVQFFDIGTKEPYSITGVEIWQRRTLVEAIQKKERQYDYKTAYKGVIEEVAYTWFNRLIAVRFMEVNDYLPSRVRVLSSESSTKNEPDLVTSPFDSDLKYTPYEKDCIMQLKNDNKLNELFRMLFIKQCNALNAILPELFEKTNDYTELLMNVSFTDKDGVVYHLVHDISEDDFNVEKEGQVEIIGWMYQYYNTEPKDETFALLKKNVKITKERIPAATQLFTPDWIVRYMVENSLGRLWLERERASSGLSNEYLNGSYFGWKYYLEEVEQEPEVEAQLNTIREEYKAIKPENIKIIDPCMGSGHILVYAFDVLMQIYESYGYSQRDAAKSILENNLYGLDIDNRAYQLAYFAVMMKARQYNRRILNGETTCQVYAIQESNGINRGHLKYFGAGINDIEHNTAVNQMEYLLDIMRDAKEYGSILNIENLNWSLLKQFVDNADNNVQMTLDNIGLDDTKVKLCQLVKIAEVMAQKYDVVVTNPPYMGRKSLNDKLSEYMAENFSFGKSELYSAFILKCLNYTKPFGYISMITAHTWMFISTFSELRNDLLNKVTINSMLHTGASTFEEINSFNVLASAFVLSNNLLSTYKGKYIRLANYYNSLEKQDNYWNLDNHYNLTQDYLKKVPNSPIVYWISENARSAFDKYKTIKEYYSPKVGLQTGDNDLFVRLWFEISNDKFFLGATNAEHAIRSECKWFPYNKGGNFRKWYGMNEYVVNWDNDGIEIKNFYDSKGKLRSRPQNLDYYFREGITWSLFGFENFGVRYKEPGFIFDVSGSSLFPDSKNVKYVLAFLCSKVAFMYLSVLAPTVNFQAGNIGDLPLAFDDNNKDLIESLASENIDNAKEDWNDFEESWEFSTHPFIKYGNHREISKSFEDWYSYSISRYECLKSNEERINSLFIEIYGLSDDISPEVNERDIAMHMGDYERDVHSFISYAIGCMFGRYSLDVDGLAYAGGEWNEGKYSTFIPDIDNILPITDEEYFEDDIVGLFCVFLKKTFGTETLEENLDFVAKALGNKGNTSREIIRNYFLKDFFKDHCKIYQKRPIYWLFDSGKADGFKALIYMHRYNADTIGNLRIDYLHRMQRVYESEISRMQETIENSTNAREVTAAQKRKEKLTKQLKETKDYDEKIAHLALARIDIDLDDGVKVNYEKVQTGTEGKKFQVLAKI